MHSVHGLQQGRHRQFHPGANPDAHGYANSDAKTGAAYSYANSDTNSGATYGYANSDASGRFGCGVRY